MRLALASICLLFVLTGTGCAGGSDDEPEARALVLTRPDVPAGFVVNPAETGPVSNAEVAQGREDGYAERLEEWGRVEGHATQFVREGVVRGALAAAESIDSVASLYDGTDGATESFASGVREYPQQGFRPAGSVQVGEEARSFRATNEVAGRSVEYLVITWRTGPVIANLVSAGRPGRIDLSILQALARKQDERITGALD